MTRRPSHTSVVIPVGMQSLHGDLHIPSAARGIVVFAHGSGSSRHSPRNQHVARVLENEGLATLLVDLLTAEEEQVDRVTADLRFDIDMLAGRLAAIVDWVKARPSTSHLPIGLFGASTGAGAALVTAAVRPNEVAAVVSRGGRPDLAAAALAHVAAPTLLIVGELDGSVLALNRNAMALMRGDVALEIVKGATHLFEEPGTLDRVATLAGSWFTRHLKGPHPQGASASRAVMP